MGVPNAAFVHLTTSEIRTPQYSGNFNLTQCCLELYWTTSSLFHCTVPDNDCSIGSEIDNTTAIVSGILASLLLLIVTIAVIIIVVVILLRHRNKTRALKRYICICMHMYAHDIVSKNNVEHTSEL